RRRRYHSGRGRRRDCRLAKNHGWRETNRASYTYGENRRPHGVLPHAGDLTFRLTIPAIPAVMNSTSPIPTKPGFSPSVCITHPKNVIPAIAAAIAPAP